MVYHAKSAAAAVLCFCPIDVEVNTRHERMAKFGGCDQANMTLDTLVPLAC